MNIRDPDIIVGGVMTTAGSIGLTVQFATEAASLIAVVLNIILAAGGIYLLLLRIRKARKDIK